MIDEKRKKELYQEWKAEEDIAHIHGWDFSHIYGRHKEEDSLPWDYKSIVLDYLKDDLSILDIDTGGGEFLLSLNHPFHNTFATEGYKPNVTLCEEKLIPLGINFKEYSFPDRIPYEDESFDIVINRHGAIDHQEIKRILKKGGLFITQQVGDNNDRDLIKMVLPNTLAPFPGMNLNNQQKIFENLGFEIIKGEESYRPIVFYDIGAFVWFARIIEWEFPSFSVDNCYDELLTMQEEIDKNGKVLGTTHRYLLVARKK